MICVTRMTSPLVKTVLPSLLVMMMMLPPHLPLHTIIVPTTNLAYVLTLVNNVTPIFHIIVTNADSAKTPAPLNGLNVKCTTPSLAHKWPKILTICVVQVRTILQILCTSLFVLVLCQFASMPWLQHLLLLSYGQLLLLLNMQPLP